MSGRNIKVGIIDLGINNIQSIYNAYKTIGCKVKLIKKKQKLLNYNLVILPGVGSYKIGMKKLRQLKIQEDLENFLNKSSNNVVIGICLGMQMLFEQSYEFGKTNGMGLIKGKVLPLNIKECQKIPHMNWSKILKNKNSEIFNKFCEKKYYFVHSYYCKPYEDNTIITKTFHGKFEFTSVVQQKNLIGLQFHPEKSGEDGLKILKQINKFI